MIVVRYVFGEVTFRYVTHNCLNALSMSFALLYLFNLLFLLLFKVNTDMAWMRPNKLLGNPLFVVIFLEDLIKKINH